MKGLEMLTGAMGFKPEMIQQGMQFLANIEAAAKQMALAIQTFNTQGQTRHVETMQHIEGLREQLVRVESNTLLLLDAADGIAPAAPSDYSVRPLPALPPMEHEPRAAIPVGD